MRQCIAAVLLTLPLYVFATPSARADTPPFASARGAFLALSVADIEASAKWYAEKLDLQIVKDRSRAPDGSSVATILQGHGLIVELIQRADAKPLHQAAPSLSRAYEIHGIFKTGLIVDDLDATLTELRRRSVDVAFTIFRDEALGYRTFAVRDNSGNFIQFFGK